MNASTAAASCKGSTPSASKIDVTDLKYQVDAAFQPNKTSTWTTPVHHDGWVLAHNSIRAEINVMHDCLTKVAQRGPLAGWAVCSLQTWWEGHATHVHSHHHNEDDVFNPWLRSRFEYPEKLEEDHDVLVQHMENIQSLILGLKQNDRVEPLLQAWTAYRDMMLPHLQEEEDVGLPLLRAYFTPAELAPVVKKMIGEGPVVEMGSFIYHCEMDGRKGPAAFRNTFMKQEGIPFFVWHLSFKKKYNWYLKGMIAHTDALASGVPPASGSRGGFFTTWTAASACLGVKQSPLAQSPRSSC